VDLAEPRGQHSTTGRVRTPGCRDAAHSHTRSWRGAMGAVVYALNLASIHSRHGISSRESGSISDRSLDIDNASQFGGECGTLCWAIDILHHYLSNG
jgi:hypothetical protein